jgi:hypothetical protein
LTNKAGADASAGLLPQKSDEELAMLLSACRQWCAGNPHSHVLDPTLDALRDEVERRTKERAQAEAKRQHEAAIGESQKLHSAVQKLQTPHWTLTPTFWISVGILIVSLAILTVAVLGWLYPVEKKPKIPVAGPANKAANSLPQELKSPPVSVAGQQTSPPAPAVIRGTNHPSD